MNEMKHELWQIILRAVKVNNGTIVAPFRIKTMVQHAPNHLCIEVVDPNRKPMLSLSEEAFTFLCGPSSRYTMIAGIPAEFLSTCQVIIYNGFLRRDYMKLHKFFD